MIRVSWWLSVLVLVGLSVSADAQVVPPPPPLSAPDANTLKLAGLNPLDVTVSLDLLKKRVQGDPKPDVVDALLVKLGSNNPEDRAAASSELIRWGPAVVARLRREANDIDNLERAEQAKKCLTQIEGTGGTNLVLAVVRHVILVQPEGAVDVLLAFLGPADDAVVAAEVSRAVVSIVGKKGTTPVLLQALEDPMPIRRATAIDAVAPLEQDAHLPALRKLLQDPKPSVRYKAAIALTNRNEESAVPVLIDALTELPPNQRLEANAHLVRIAGEWAITVPQGNDDVAARVRKEAWLGWWKGTDGTQLLGELKKRTLSEADWEKALNTIQKLGDDQLTVREQAYSDLLALGGKVVPVLRQQQTHRDPRVAAYVVKCLAALDSDKSPPLPTSTIRLLSLRKPADAAAVFLDYLPCCETEAIRKQIGAALRNVGVRDGKIDPALERGLESKIDMCRLAAAEVLAEKGGPAYRPKVRKLLDDRDPEVRVRVGLALAASQDREVVPLLIDLFGSLTPQQSEAIHDFLLRLAGTKAPTVALGTTAESRQKCRDAWAEWWAGFGSKIDWTKIEHPRWLLGQALIVEQFEPIKRMGRVLELDAWGRIVWQIDGLQAVTDAQMLPTGVVWVLENSGSKLTERDLKGTILSEKQLVGSAITFQKLANGNTFVVFRHQLLEYDSAWKEVFNYQRPNNDIFGARKQANGEIAFYTIGNPQRMIRLDQNQKEVSSINVSPMLNLQYYPVEPLPDGRALVCLYSQNRVVEVGDSGKVVWEANVQFPQHAVRLANGNVLVGCPNAMRIVEIDRAGKIVWESADGLRAFRVRRR